MNGKQILIIKQALDKINEELYNELPTEYANKAIKIFKDNIVKTIDKLMNKS